MAQAATAIDDGDYPLANTRAAHMISEALERASRDDNQSARQIAKILGYKTSTVLSHMATGRAPVPLDRAMDFARILKIDARELIMAILEQRHPGIDFPRVLFGGKKNMPKSSKSDEEDFIVEELESVAGQSLSQVASSKMRVVKEVLREPRPEGRWLSLNELPFMESFRKARPDVAENGLSFSERRKLEDFLKDI